MISTAPSWGNRTRPVKAAATHVEVSFAMFIIVDEKANFQPLRSRRKLAAIHGQTRRKLSAAIADSLIMAHKICRLDAHLTRILPGGISSGNSFGESEFELMQRNWNVDASTVQNWLDRNREDAFTTITTTFWLKVGLHTCRYVFLFNVIAPFSSSQCST